jgi:hypothetical protein
VVGVDEHTALVLDLQAETCRVLGKGGVVVQRDRGEKRFEHGQTFPVQELGPFHPIEADTGLPREVWARARAAHATAQHETPLVPPPEVRLLVEEREAARTSQDWATADQLRERIEAAGWRVLDTRQGPQVNLAPEKTP